MQKSPVSRSLCLILALVMVLGLFPAVSAAPGDLHWEPTGLELPWNRNDRLIQPSDTADAAIKTTGPVRVSIVLKDPSTVQAGFSTSAIPTDSNAASYDLELLRQQKSMERIISDRVLGGEALDVVWNLTTVCNIISANVPMDRLDAIRALPGVADVIPEQQYEPQTAQPDSASSGAMIGATRLWQIGLTGAGTRIAIIDTGTDTDHQSFDNGAYLHSLAENAARLGMGREAYIDSLDLLDSREIAGVLAHLNAAERVGASAEQFFLNEKLPFGANYVDRDLNVGHDRDYQGSHGSHVAGIAAANRYIPQGDGYADALSSVFMTGVAPDAQIITLKVFGNTPGPYDSDYFAAIEDAIWLGCDSVNLSLGSGAPGASESPLFTELLDHLADTDTVVVMSAGNSGAWAEHTAPGALYDDGVSFHTAGEPGTFTNSLAVASVENDGTVGLCIDVDGLKVPYQEGTGYYLDALTSLDTSYDGSGTAYDYIFIDGTGLSGDYEGIDLFNKVIFCSRGDISFEEKAENAAMLGAAAIIVYNNTSGIFQMDLGDYRYNTPCVSILQKDAAAIRDASEVRTTQAGLTYRTGSLVIGDQTGVFFYGSEYYTMSGFSSWGVPGSLKLKPEITAPGGSIRSVDGIDPSGTAYEVMSGTSMAAPQVSGMAALVSQYIRQQGLSEETGLSARHLAQSLLMSTAVPLREEASGSEYYTVLNQGAGLARVDLAVCAESYVLVEGMSDGKVKAELGEDAAREGVYEFTFTIQDLSAEDRIYSLRADLFTQALQDSDDGTRYLSSQTRTLPVRAQFFLDGVSLECAGGDFSQDLNGDGITDARDADHLLEYLVGNADRLWADGDISGDGQVTSYDAHALLTRLGGSYRVEVPANGSVSIQVRLELTDEARSLLDGDYPVGAYLEGYVFAQPLADAEGVVGVSHSIPVLGYYGSWSESSMYDVGSYAEYASTSETRVPYLYDVNDIRSNYLTVSPGEREEYLFGGNPYVQEDAYLPQRNAFNNQKGWIIRNLRFTQIRNAAASMLLLENADTGGVYLFQEQGRIDGAYYHVNSGSWHNTQYTLPLGLDLSGFPEGTRLTLSLISAPELYCTYDPDAMAYTADWDALAEGARLESSITIDNTSPEIRDLQLDENQILRITARDNQYIAAAAVLSADGSDMLSVAAANQTEQGQEMTIELDLSQVYGSEFLVAVYDYAENSAVCTAQLDLDSQRPYFTCIDPGNSCYLGLGADGTHLPLAYTAQRQPLAAEYAEGAVFEISSDLCLYAAYDEDLYRFTCLGQLDPADAWDIEVFLDMAYNRCDGQLYALFYSDLNGMFYPYLAVIDPHSGGMTVLGEMPIDANAITIDAEGNFYSTIYASSQLYRYSADVVQTRSAELIGSIGKYRTIERTCLAWDHNTGELYWSFCQDEVTSLLKLDPKTAEYETLCSYPSPIWGLYIAYAPISDRFAPTDQVRSLIMEDSATTLVNNTLRLNPRICPWNVSDSSLIWCSSDPQVASVDEDGLVTGLSAGTAVITAASVLDRSVTASCTVTVKALGNQLQGLIWDETGQVWWSSFRTDDLPAYEKRSASDQPLNATMMADGKLYASALLTGSGSSYLYQVDPQDFTLTPVGPSSAAYLDLAYAPSLGYGLAVYYTYVLLVDLQTGEYVGAWDWSEWEAADLVGITYYGTEYNELYGTNMDYFLLLDADGKVYLDAWANDGGYFGYFNGPQNGYVTAIGPAVDIPYFQGFHYDGTNAYWTRYCEAEDSVELIVWDCDGTGEVYTLGRFGQSVWPVGGLYMDSQLSGTMALAHERLSTAAMKPAVMTASVPLKHDPAAKGSLNAAQISETEEPLYLSPEVPAGTEAPVSGTLTVTFDPAALELTGVRGDAEAFAWNLTGPGTLHIAFAHRKTLPDDAAPVRLRFHPLGTGETIVQVHWDQWNMGSLDRTEEFLLNLPDASMPFEDVPSGSFYYDPVLWAISAGITTGTSDTTFSPGGNCLRAAVVTFLWRASGSPEPESTRNPFRDVQETDFFYKAVLWAVENGITNGTSADAFSPYAECNRAQVVTFLWRAMGQPTPDSSHSPFADVVQGLWYTQPVLWAVENSITNGMGDGTFGVGTTCNRAQVVTFLYRALVE